MSDKTQNFFGGKDDIHAITAISISSKHTFIAVASKGNKPNSGTKSENPKIGLYDPTHLRVRKTISLPEDFKETMSEYVYLAWPGDSEQKFISLSSPAPNPILCVWGLDKNPARLLMSTVVSYNSPCQEILFNLNDTSYISAIGKKTYKYWKMQDNLRVVHQNFTGPAN